MNIIYLLVILLGTMVMNIKSSCLLIQGKQHAHSWVPESPAKLIPHRRYLSFPSVLSLRGGHLSRKRMVQKLKEETAGNKAVGQAPNEPEGEKDVEVPQEVKRTPLTSEAKKLKKAMKQRRKQRKLSSKVEKTTKPKPKEKAPFRPWVDKPGEDEVLVPSLEAYECLFPMNVEWPSLSFDFVEDARGPKRGFPIAATIVAGTQALSADQNKLTVMDIFGLRRFRKKKDENDPSESENDDESSYDGYEVNVKGMKVEPKVHHYSASHNGTVNKVRCQPQSPTIMASFSDSGAIHIYNMSSPLESRLIHTYTEHDCEGFALGWSTVASGSLASGDVSGNVYIRNFHGNNAKSSPPRLLSGHTASIEDLCWSPTEAGVLITCSDDKSIRFWDLSLPKGKECALIIENAHDCDVNALSWNALEQHLLLSGGEDGSIKVWDLGALKNLGQRVVPPSMHSPIAVYTFHKLPINNLDWHPTDSSLFLASCRDDSVSVWDVSVERDEATTPVEEKFGLQDMPAQLLFLHQGQKEMCEARWHPLLPSVVFSSAAEGFNIWRASTL